MSAVLFLRQQLVALRDFVLVALRDFVLARILLRRERRDGLTRARVSSARRARWIALADRSPQIIGVRRRWRSRSRPLVLPGIFGSQEVSHFRRRRWLGWPRRFFPGAQAVEVRAVFRCLLVHVAVLIRRRAAGRLAPLSRGPARVGQRSCVSPRGAWRTARTASVVGRLSRSGVAPGRRVAARSSRTWP
jgi:hypothetical protein